MPIYDYHCDHCGHAFSAVQSFKDDALGVCPSCGKKPRRLITSPAIVFKGSGWYKTDSRTAPPASSDSTSKDGAAAETAGGSTHAAKTEPAKPKDKPAAEAASS